MGLMVAIKRNQSCPIKSRGRLIDDKKMATKNSGNALSTASTEPVFIASIAPIPPNPRATSTVRSTITTMPKNPLLTSTPISVPTVRKTTPCRKPSATTPVSIPPSSHGTHRGEREPVEEAALDVAGQVGAGRDRTEERGLYERESEREIEVRVGRETGYFRGGVEAVRVDGEE